MTNIDITAGLAAFFEQDHQDCDARWAELEEQLAGADEAAGQALWQAFESSMRRHLAMEEDILFPAFESRSGLGGDGPTAVMRLEHQQMRALLDLIGAAMANGNTEEAMDFGDTLLMLIQQHNFKEEGMLYTMAESVLSGEWAELASQLEKY